MSSSNRRVARKTAKKIKGAGKAMVSEYNDCIQICEVYIPKALEVSSNIKEVIKTFEAMPAPTEVHREILVNTIAIEEELDAVLPVMVKTWDDLKVNKPPFEAHDAMTTLGDIEIIYSGKLTLMDIHSRYALMVENEIYRGQ